jgi:16S rRNA (adenine1518-N6/adenine1519-N6)-dimethyltransferase
MEGRREGFRPRRGWGQNFLINEGACDTIIRAFLPRPEDRVLEIGPGKGALTRRLMGKVGRILAVEVDPALAGPLRETVGRDAPPGTFEVLTGDILAIEPGVLFEALGATDAHPGRVLANLPYNIATAVILRLLPLRPRLRDLMLMVQREVAERIASPPGPKAYGSLSVLCQSFARVDMILKLGPGSFRPRPKVDSQVLRMVLRDPGGAAGRDFQGYARLLRAAFARRRKTILNNLATEPPGGSEGHARAGTVLRAAGIDPRLRAEEVPVAGFLALFEAWTGGNGATGL